MAKNTLPVDVLVIGAGAAGLMCAIEAGKRGRNVVVLEKSNKPGKKILMSGGGRCNFTNLHVKYDRYLSHNPHFCKSALSRYTPADFIALVEAYKIPYYEKTLGQLFCQNKSKDILDMLLQECAKYKVRIFTDQTVVSVKEGFEVSTQQTSYHAQSLVVATGGLSIPTLGSSPFGFKVAEQFGHHIHPLSAGLVPFTLQPTDLARFANLAGVSQMCEVRVGQVQFKESLLFTHRGLSGPVILQISSYWQPGQLIEINFLPKVDLIEVLHKARAQRPKSQLKQHLEMPASLIDCLLGELAHKRMADLSNAAIDLIAKQLAQFTLVPNATEGYRTAEVTRGGIDCHELCSKTMQSKKQPHLYFIGEVVDVTGWLGGYNFQWAWSSGWAAGQVV